MRQLLNYVFSYFTNLFISSLVVLVATLLYLWLMRRGNKRKSQLSFPGLAPSDLEHGNFGDIKKAGSLHEFLVGLHKRFGPITYFWWGKELTVSLGSPELWKDVSSLFDRPVNQFLMFQPVFGKYSLTYINGADGKRMRQYLDRSYSHQAMIGYVDIFTKIGHEIVKKWKSMATNEHIPLRQDMLAISLKAITRSSFGDYFDSDEKILEFRKLYDDCWFELEKQLDGHVLEPGSEREKQFKEALRNLKEITVEVVRNRRNQKDKKHHVLLDTMLEEDSHFTSDEMISDNALTYLIGGFHTTGTLLAWIIYYLSKDRDVQNKVYNELQDVVGDRELTMDNIGSLRYMRQVIDEGMRASVVAPWSARCSEYDIVVGGHTIPKDTPIILPNGVLHQDPETWPEPERFDPSRFDPEKNKKRHPLAFTPFGFAGKRKCPAYRFSYVEETVFLAMLVKNFKFNLVEGQMVEKAFGFVTHPKEEIWLTVDQRQT